MMKTLLATKLKILALHGYHGNATIMESQLHGLASAMHPHAEIVYAEAPSLADDDFGWWHAVDDSRSNARENPGVSGQKIYKGWDKSRQSIEKIFREQGPFDGILGFSQGAALSGLLVGLRAPAGKATAEKPLVFDFAIMVGGFPSRDGELAHFYADKASYNLPTAHIIGRSDGIVPPKLSQDLAKKFPSPLVLEHAAGHVIAETAEVKAGIVRFLQERQKKKKDSKAAATRPQVLDLSLWGGDKRMRVHFPERGEKLPAMLVFQGGAYATDSGSGSGTAEWLAKQGIVGIRVDYGTQGRGEAFPQNYADAARAIRLARYYAKDWGIDPQRIGVIGYSAGGHLASLLSTQPDLYQHPQDQLAKQFSAKPDLVVLAYPVISFVDGYSPGALAGSVENFLGDRAASLEVRQRFSNERHVKPEHAPTFIWTTATDSLVPARHAKLFADALRKAQVPLQFKTYPEGPHGLGLALQDRSEASGWTRSLLSWLRLYWKF